VAAQLAASQEGLSSVNKYGMKALVGITRNKSKLTTEEKIIDSNWIIALCSLVHFRVKHRRLGWGGEDLPNDVYTTTKASSITRPL
jgi:hypothetical protein